jgi:CubicO group peptidase (beta-lactamase class C family)
MMKKIPKYLVVLCFLSVFGAFFPTELDAQIRERGAAQVTDWEAETHVWPTTLPESVGMSSTRLANLDSMLLKAIVQEQIPGAVALIVRDGYIVYEKAFGTANPTTREAYQTDQIFRIASQTKAITATAVMMLWEQGRFLLDDPISKYVPEFGAHTVLVDFNEADSSYTTRPAEGAITIRHLLTHTSGLGYGIIDGDHRMRKIYQKAGVVDLYSTEDVSIAESVQRLAGLPLHHDPGARFTYSEGLDVLGYLVEVLSGQTFDQFLKEHLFDPLGMMDTQFYLRPEQYRRLVPVQTKDSDGEWVIYEGHPDGYYDAAYPIQGAKRFFSGGAGLSSTAQDYARFLQMYLNGGVFNEHRILSPTTIDLIMSNQTGDFFGGGKVYYGLAFGVVTDQGFAVGGRGSVGTFDWGGYFNTQYYADPELGIIGILMKQTQRTPSEPTRDFIKQIVGASVEEK